MIILGLNQIPSSRARKHDSAVAIIYDGKVVASAEEERFNRIKHTNSQATQALDYCLNTAGVSLKDIDIGSYSNVNNNIKNYQLEEYRKNIFPFFF